MFENQNVLTTKPSRLRLVLMSALGLGMVASSMHGALLDNHYSNTTAVDLNSKAISELHTHSSINLQPNRVLIDPKSLRSVRSEGDKQAEADGLRGNWDVYTA